MPDNWNPEVYRERARQWREKAEALPHGQERETCVVIADGYARLARLIEDDVADQTPPGA
jgi:hypothetical protein